MADATPTQNPDPERLAELGHAHAHLAHEIQRVLVTIGLLARSLDKSEHLGGDDRETVRKIIRQERIGEELLQDILDLVTPIEKDRSAEDVRDVLREVREALLPHAREADVDVDLKPADRPCRVPAVRKKLRQALLNLADNAVDAVSDGGGTVELACERNADHVTVTVRDSGPGMTDDQVARMFEPFESSKEGGTGLGLALARKIIEDHDGSIDVDSRPGRGTAVTVRLPQAKGADDD
jgi:signal transduction histidine kinase